MRLKKIAIVVTVLLLVLITLLSRSWLKVEDQIVPEVAIEVSSHSEIGKSVLGRSIDAYTFGTGETQLAFVGGMHGGYEWNSVLLAYSLIDYLQKEPTSIPKNISVTVIPSVNPDGVFNVIGKEGRFTLADIPEGAKTEPGRFNANDVDLNRNFDCKWKSKSTWRGKEVSAGITAFSEPEAQAVRDFFLGTMPSAVIFWHSQANAVYASECEEGILPMTREIMNAYANAAEYPAIDTFDAYEITGDADGWLASIGIPAITVELKTHEAIEWEKNLNGIKAVFDYFFIPTAVKLDTIPEL
ncbi:MAG: M14 family metallopeptidase [bacterium]|nr:M14 family metallopeptidase [bacterium]